MPTTPHRLTEHRFDLVCGVEVLRTPDARFVAVRDFPFGPRYLDVTAHDDAPPLRMHYVDEGPRSGSPVMMLHGQPTWSYLYRTMISPLAAAGHRVVAPDLIGFGRSDKPSSVGDYTYQRHVQWVTSWLRALDLHDVTAFVQDWGSLIGLRVIAENAERFSRIVIANGFLPTADRRPPLVVPIGRLIAKHSPFLPSAGWMVNRGTVHTLSRTARDAYNAPFPDQRYLAGMRAFPGLVPTSPDDPATPANRAAWQALGRWAKPVLCLFGTRDPLLGKYDAELIRHIPGAKNQPHARIHAGHFIQEDAGPELAQRMLAWSAASTCG